MAVRPLVVAVAFSILLLASVGGAVVSYFYGDLNAHNAVAIEGHVIDVKKHPPTVIERNHYVPAYYYSGDDAVTCPPPEADFVFNETQAYRNVPIHGHFQHDGCFIGFDLTYSLPGEAEAHDQYVTFLIPHSGYLRADWVAYFEGGDEVRGSDTIFVQWYAPAIPPEDVPDEWATYQEYNPLDEDFTFGVDWFITNGEAWSNRDYAMAMFNVWWSTGNQVPGFAWGKGGTVSVHIPYMCDADLELFACSVPTKGLLLSGIAHTQSQPVPPQMGCKYSYLAPTHWVPTMGQTPLAGGAFGFISESMGCGFDNFVPGGTMHFLIFEADGVITEGCVPWHGEQGPGCLYDEADIYLEWVF